MAIVANLNAIEAKCESERNAEEANGQLEPCILFMDSLLAEKLHDAEDIAANIRSYLLRAWQQKQSERASKRAKADSDCGLAQSEPMDLGTQYTAILRALPLVRPQNPQQTNLVYCGLYVCQNVEELLIRWPDITKGHVQSGVLEGYSSDMYPAQSMKDKRVALEAEIRRLIAAASSD